MDMSKKAVEQMRRAEANEPPGAEKGESKEYQKAEKKAGVEKHGKKKFKSLDELKDFRKKKYGM